MLSWKNRIRRSCQGMYSPRKPAGPQTLLLGVPDRHVLVDARAARHLAGDARLVLDLVVDRHPVAHRVREVLRGALGEQSEVPHVEVALLRVAGMRRGAQPDAAVGLHAERDVREHRVVVVVGQLLVGVVREVVALGRAELALALLQRRRRIRPDRRGTASGSSSQNSRSGLEALEACARACPWYCGPGPPPGMSIRACPDGYRSNWQPLWCSFIDAQRLGVHEGQVVALVEVVLHALPVELAHHGHPVGALHVLHAVGVEVIGDGVERTHAAARRARPC